MEYHANQYVVRGKGPLCVGQVTGKMRPGVISYGREDDGEVLKWLWWDPEFSEYLDKELARVGFDTRKDGAACGKEMPSLHCDLRKLALTSRWIPISGRYYHLEAELFCELRSGSRIVLARPYRATGWSWYGPVYVSGAEEGAVAGACDEAAERIAYHLVTDVAEALK